ncbi:MAG: DUF2252 domain-containing protein, partial [Acidimicrobiales bacterium]
MRTHPGQHLLFGAHRALRREAGKAHRREVPLERHAELPQRAVGFDAVGILTEQDSQRQQHLVPIRHGRMSASAFTFYRGGAAIMAADLNTTPTTDLPVQLCGDAHLSNFGLFNGPDRRLLFDVNDFDETLPGPFEWDLKRLAASVTIAGRNNEISEEKTARATRAAVRGYRETIAQAADMSPLDMHYYRLEAGDIAAVVNKGEKKRTKKVTAKAKRKNSLRAFNKLTKVVGGERKIVAEPPLIVPVADDLGAHDRDRLRSFVGAYMQTLPTHRRLLLERYKPVDMAHKVVGVGSVGTECWIALMVSGDEEPLFLQIKEATQSVLEPYLGNSEYEQSGQRVVEGQRLMQATGDILLGWSRLDRQDERGARDFYFRQLWDGKASADIGDMGGK